MIEKKRPKYIIFGGGSFLSDVFDLIHAVNGTVYKIFLNMPEADRSGDIGSKQRVSWLSYDVNIYESLQEF